MKKQAVWALLSAAVISVAATRAADVNVDRPFLSDGYFARQMMNLHQVHALEVATAKAKGTPAESLYDAALVQANWAALTKNEAKKADVLQRYLTDLTEAAAQKNVDPYWALDQATFIFAKVTDPIVTKIEYFGASATMRENLEPWAKAASQLLTDSNTGLSAAMDAVQNAPVWNPAAYKIPYAASGEVTYNLCFAQYFLALSEADDAAGRSDLLNAAEKGLAQWADGPADSGVKYQALLLRGKVRSELGHYDDATADFTAAEAKDTPGWVQFQARYQTIVAAMRKKDFQTASADLETFAAWIDGNEPNKAAAQVSLDMLHYRVVATQAAEITDPAARQEAQTKAMGILSDLVAKNPSYRDLVFQQLAAGAAPEGDLTKMPPLQALAVANNLTANADAQTPAGQKALDRALEATSSVRHNPDAAIGDQKEAALIAAVANGKLQKHLEAAQADVDFAELSEKEHEQAGTPVDARAKPLVEAALAQIGQLLRTETAPSKEVDDVKARALALATGTFKDTRWLYAQGVSLLDDDKLDDAENAFQQIPATDPNYVDARYQILRIGVRRLNGANDDATRAAAGKSLLAACQSYLEAGATPEARKSIAQYEPDVLLIEASTALTALHDTAGAMAYLNRLEAQKNLTPQLRGGILRYRLLAYQMEGKPDEAAKTVEKYVQEFPAQAADILKGMIAKSIEEIDDAPTPAKAQQIAGQVVPLIQSLITWAKTNAQRTPAQRVDDVYNYEQILGEMLTRADNTQDAIALFDRLQAQKPPDLYNFMGEARAIFAARDYAKAHDYFVRIIPKLAPGSESYWEAYLRVLQCNEAMGKNRDDTIRTLKDLRGSYGDAIGGKQYKRQYRELLDKYGIA